MTIQKIKGVTIGIVTFKRDEKLRQLLSSIRERYAVETIIADNGIELPCTRNSISDRSDWSFANGSFYILPFDCGLSASRNFLCGYVVDSQHHDGTNDLLILDDDFFFTDETDIRKMQDVLASNPDVGFVCGDAGFTNPMNFDEETGRLVEACSLLYRTTNGTEYQICDLADNFMLIRNEAIGDGVRWNAEFKTGEHRDFFERVKRSRWKVAFVPSVKIGHDCGGESREYQDYRSRCCTFHKAKAVREDGFEGKRIIAVVGPFRGGTSCVAGMLHKLGVSMGDDLKPPKSANPTGFFESESLGDICRASFPEPFLEENTSRDWRIQKLREWADIRSNGVIGAKHPTLCLMVPDMIEAWPDLRIVIVSRPVKDVDSSIRRLGWGWPKNSIYDIVSMMIQVRDEDSGSVCHLYLPYRQCIDSPFSTARLLADFSGIRPTDEQLLAAANHPDERLQHHGKVEAEHEFADA